MMFEYWKIKECLNFRAWLFWHYNTRGPVVNGVAYREHAIRLLGLTFIWGTVDW